MPRDTDPVFVCTRCGRGFLTAQPRHRGVMVDQYPLWAVLSTMDLGEGGDVCMGEVTALTRLRATQIAEQKGTASRARSKILT